MKRVRNIMRALILLCGAGCLSLGATCEQLCPEPTLDEWPTMDLIEELILRGENIFGDYA